MEHVITRAYERRGAADRGRRARTAIFDRPSARLHRRGPRSKSSRRRAEKVDLDRIRPDLAKVYERHAKGLDPARPEAVARRAQNPSAHRARERRDLCDSRGTFVEYGSDWWLAALGRRRRRSFGPILMKNTPAGLTLVAGIRPSQRRSGLTTQPRANASRMSYDYTPCSPAPRASRTIARKTACSKHPPGSACPWCSSPRAAAGVPATADGLWLSGLDVPAFPLLGEAERPGADGRRQLGPMLRGQRGGCSDAATWLSQAANSNIRDWAVPRWSRAAA